MKLKTLIIALSLLTLIIGCRDRVEPEVDDFVEYGWTLYAERDFRGAHEQFQEGLAIDSLYIDGYNGSGWCYVEFNEPDSALAFFREGLIYNNEDSSQVQYELLAGFALSYHAIGDFEQAIIQGTKLYNYKPIFEFSHNWQIDYVDIVIMLAASNYAEGDFAAALTWVQELDEAFTADITTNEGRAELIKKIELLQN